jgi:large subunit ribosomal protein L7/L12
MATIEEQIKVLEEKRKKIDEEHKKKIKQLKAKQERMDAQSIHALIKGNRADDTRRKILAGSLILDIIYKDDAAKNKFIPQLDKYLTRDDDRALFGLNPLEKVTPDTPQ